MGYGIGGLLLAIGLILALAVDVDVSGVDLRLVGWILAAVGVLALLISAFSLLGGGGRTRIDR